MRAELGPSSAPDSKRLIRAAFELLDLISFFTADTDKEAMARTLPPGAGPPTRRPGRVHGDIQRKFVRAEVVRLGRAGRRRRVRRRPRPRHAADSRAATYVVQDGDVVHNQDLALLGSLRGRCLEVGAMTAPSPTGSRLCVIPRIEPAGGHGPG